MDHNGRLNQMFALSDPSSCFAAGVFLIFSRTTSVTLVASLPENFEYHPGDSIVALFLATPWLDTLSAIPERFLRVCALFGGFNGYEHFFGVQTHFTHSYLC